MDTEDNSPKGAAIESVVSKFWKLSLRIRDSVCACSFSVAYYEGETPGRPHAKNHKREVCKRKFNPSKTWNPRIRYRHGRANTAARDHIFRYFDQQSAAQKMGRENYRAFWRHACIYYNSHVACVRKEKLSLNNPCVSRRLKIRAIGGR